MNGELWMTGDKAPPCPACGGASVYRGEALFCGVRCINCGLHLSIVDKRGYRTITEIWSREQNKPETATLEQIEKGSEQPTDPSR